MMQNISSLCDKDLKIDGEEFSQLHYGARNSENKNNSHINCIKISLVQKSDPEDLVSALFEGLIDNSDLNEADLIRLFNDNKSSLTLEDISESESQKKELIDKYENPSDLKDISEVVKSLNPGEIIKVLEWFCTEFKEVDDYPGFYLDEFEFMVRHNPEGKVRDIVQFIIRKAAEYGKDQNTSENPPFLLFANTTRLGELKQELNVPRDFISRISDSIAYNLDLSPEETKTLFKKLYRLYAIPILEQSKDEDKVESWLEELQDKELHDTRFAYPFTEEALQFIVSQIQTHTPENSDDKVIRAFRVYKSILTEFLALWDEGDIDKSYLYRNGDKVRENLDSNTLVVDIESLPGKKQVNELIEKVYLDVEGSNKVIMGVLKAIAKESILSDNPSIFSREDITSLADQVGHENLSSDEMDNLFEVALSQDYFEKEGERLHFKKEIILSDISPEDTLPKKDRTEKIVEEHSLVTTSIIDLWTEALKERNPEMNLNSKEDYIEFDVAGEIQYTEKIFLCFDETPNSLKRRDEETALGFVITLRSSEISNSIATYEVKEEKERVDNAVQKIEESLNSELRERIITDEKSDVINNIHKWFNKDKYESFKLLLKISLLHMKGEELPDFLQAWTVPNTVFEITDYVKSNITGSSGAYPFVLEQLGFEDTRYRNRKSNQLMDIAYAVRKMEKENSENLIYERAGDPKVEIPNFGGASPGDRNSEEFESLIKDKFSNEAFISGKDISTPFSTKMENVIDLVEENMEDGISLNEVARLLFGTEHIQNNSRAAIYLVLILGEYREKWKLDEKGDSVKVVSPEEDEEIDKDQIREKLRNKISWDLVVSLSKNEVEGEIENKLNQYKNIESLEEKELEELQNLEVEQELEVETDIKQIKELRSNKGFPTYTINYLGTLIDTLNKDKYLVRLVIHRVRQLIEELEKTEKVLNKRLEIEELKKKIEKLSEEEREISLEKDSIDPLSGIKDHFLENDIEEQISDSPVKSSFEDFFSDPGSLDIIVRRLKEIRDVIVPEIENYDPSSQIDLLTEDKETFEDELEDIKKERLDDLEAEEELVEDKYKPNIVKDKNNWVRRGEKALKNCREAMEKEISDIEVEKYENNWRRWEDKIKPKIENELIPDGKEVQTKLERYGVDFAPSEISDASKIRVQEIIETLPDDESEEIIDKLKELESEESKNLLKYIINRKIIAEA